MCSDIEAPAGGKIEQFLREFENGGVLLTEAERYVNHRPYKPSEEHRMVKQWEIHVDWMRASLPYQWIRRIDVHEF